MRRSSLIFCSLVLVLTAHVATAQAVRPISLPTPATPRFGPALAGNSVIYGSLDYTYDANANRYGHVHAWRTRASGASDLAYFESSNVARRVDLSGGPEAFAAGFSEIDDCASSDVDSAVTGTCTVRSEAVVGPLAGGHRANSCFPHIDRPNDAGAPQFSQPLIAVSGPYFVRPVDGSVGCGPTSRIVVSNALLPGHDTVLPLAAKSLLGVAMNGSTLVLANRRSRNGFSIASYDLTKGRLIYQRIFTTPTFKYRVGFDVDEDGNVALAAQLLKNRRSTRSLCSHRQTIVLLDAAGDPTCELDRTATLEVKFARETLMYYRGTGAKNSVAQLIERFPGSGQWHVLRRTRRALHEPFDFDGRRIAWIDQGCSRPQIRYAELDANLEIDPADCNL